MAFDNIKLEKGMYHEGSKPFAQVLEELDPSEAYKGTALEGTDAFQRQLKRFNIRVKGPISDPVEKFFSTFESSVLFPEFISRIVRQGAEENNILPSMVATVTKIDGMDYRSIFSTADDRDKALADVAEGAPIPATSIRTRDSVTKLHKRGRMLIASYEALRFQKLDLFSVMLRQIGAYIQRAHLADAVDLILKEADTLEVGTAPITAGTTDFSYDALIDFWAQFHPYEVSTLLVGGSAMTKLLKLAEFQNPATGLNFQGTGKLTTPIGAELFRTDAVQTDAMIALDRRYALEMVQAGDITVEYDKLIDRQLERAAITSICGFSMLFKDAAKVLEL